MKSMILALALVSAPATAGPTLWQNVEAGMTADQVRALYPQQGGTLHKKDQVVIQHAFTVGECQPHVRAFHPKGVVTNVTIESDGCREKVMPMLISKYGEHATQETAKPMRIDFGKSQLRKALESMEDAGKRGMRTTIWIKDGVTVTFVEPEEGSYHKWRITYAAQDANNF